MSTYKSLIDLAYEVLTESYSKNGENVPMGFATLLTEVGKKAGITDENRLSSICSRFYTALTTDGRFVIKENNTWVLREHELFENVHIDMNDVYSDPDEEEENLDELGNEEQNMDEFSDKDDDSDDEKLTFSDDLDEEDE